MEAHEEVDFGVPGALVHLLERFYCRGYEGLLLESIGRKPTSHTVWMLNRLINGSRNSEERVKYLGVMRDVSANAMADDDAREDAQYFLGLQTWSLRAVSVPNRVHFISSRSNRREMFCSSACWALSLAVEVAE